MKVVLFATRFAFEHSIELANALCKHKKVSKVYLFLPSNKLSIIQQNQISSRIVFLPYFLPAYKNIIYSSRIFYKVVTQIRKINPNIIHIQGSAHPYFWLFFPLIRNIPIVDTIHDPQPHPGFGNILQTFMRKKGAKLSKRWFIHGNILKDQFLKKYKVKSEYVKVIPKGHYEIFKKYNNKSFKEEETNILFFGNVTKYKGINILIESSKQVIKEFPNTKFVIAGKTRRKDNIDLSDLNNHKNYILKNYRISEEEVPKLFQKASIVVLPYIEASQSGVISIAFGFGKAIIVTNVGALPEIVKNGKTGIIIPPNNSDILAQEIIRLLKDDKLRKTLGNNAYLFAKNELSWEKIANITFNVYKELNI